MNTPDLYFHTSYLILRSNKASSLKAVAKYKACLHYCGFLAGLEY